jgi:hypothetical protein
MNKGIVRLVNEISLYFYFFIYIYLNIAYVTIFRYISHRFQ